MEPEAPRKERLKRLALACVAIFAVAANAYAYLHAYALHHFADSGARTKPPEKLSVTERFRVLVAGVNIPRPENRRTPSVPFETVRIPSTDGVILEGWWIAHPQSRGSVLLVHGYSASKSSLLDEAHAFADLGFSTLLIDCRGSGGSSGSETTVGVREAEDVRAAVEHMRGRQTGEPILLFGQSMGAAAILRAVGVLDVRAEAIIVESVFDTMLSAVVNRFHSMGLPGFPAAPLLVFWGGVQQGFNGFAHNPADYAASVHVPTLLLHGARDVRATETQARNVYDHLAGSKRLEVFPTAGHNSLLGADSARWREAVAKFLEQADGSRADSWSWLRVA